MVNAPRRQLATEVMSETPQKAQHLYCNVTFTQQGSIGPDGEAIQLKRCARCRCTYYISREAQKSHWKVHKKVCKSPDDYTNLKRRIFDSDAKKAVEILEGILDSHPIVDRFAPNSPEAGFAYIWVLQRLEHLAKQGDKTEYMIRAVNILGLGIWIDAEVEKLWAVPGMTTYLLNLDFVSETVKKMGLENDLARGPPPYRLMEQKDRYEPPFYLNPEFCKHINSVLSGSALFRDRNGINNFDSLQEVVGRSASLRSTAISVAASRKVMSMLSDRWTYLALITPYEVMAPKGIPMDQFMELFIVLVASRESDPGDPSMILPGLSYESAVRVMLHFIATAGSRKFGSQFEIVFHDFETVFNNFLDRNAKSSAWNAFSVSRRAVLACDILTHFLVDETDEEDFVVLKPERKQFCLGIMVTIMGLSMGEGRDDPSLWLKVIKESRRLSGDRQGMYFQDWLDTVLRRIRPSLEEFLRLARVSLPEDVKTLICEYCFDPYAMPVPPPE